jgi:CHAD domain-containing protein
MYPVKLNDRSGAVVNARRILPVLAGEYFAQVRGLLAGTTHPRDLHRIRLATKHFRYTLELFRPCYGSGLETRIATLRNVQRLLGDINDCVASWELLSKTLPKSPTRTKVKEYLKNQAEHDAEDFRKEWKEKFDAPGREGWWKVYLRNAGKSA